MNFKQWLESYRWDASNTDQMNANISGVNMGDSRLQQKFIEKNIEGWQVFFVDNRPQIRHDEREKKSKYRLNPNDPNYNNVSTMTSLRWKTQDFFTGSLEAYAEKYGNKILPIIKIINKMGIKLRIPIIINCFKYTNPVIRGGNSTTAWAIGQNIVLGSNNLGNSHTVIHELSHTIFAALPSEDKEKIKEMAYSLPSPSTYGSPHWKGQNYSSINRANTSHLEGDEWFAEMVSIILAGNRDIASWFRKTFLGHKYKQSDIDTLHNFITKPL